MPLQEKLLQWFGKNQRPLPWRRRCLPYEVWISEIMLQQTQMDTVLPYFDRWMKAFPTLRSLAESDGKKVLKLWEGLGYYSRARNLHQTARDIVEKHGGEFPSDFDSILSLKGVGRYTAGAIASIAFNEPRPIVDGNVLRVLSRLYAIRDNIDLPQIRERFWTLQEELIPKNKARHFNQALMELGALVCSTNDPACGLCPIRTHCKAYKEGKQEDYPVRNQRKKMVKVEAAALILKRGGKCLLRLRPVGAIMGGLWEFPEWKLASGAALTLEQKKSRMRRLAGKEFGTNGIKLEHAGRIKRNYTHHLERLDVFSADAENELVPKTAWEYAWVTPKEFSKYPFSSAHAKIAALL